MQSDLIILPSESTFSVDRQLKMWIPFSIAFHFVVWSPELNRPGNGRKSNELNRFARTPKVGNCCKKSGFSFYVLLNGRNTFYFCIYFSHLEKAWACGRFCMHFSLALRSQFMKCLSSRKREIETSVQIGKLSHNQLNWKSEKEQNRETFVSFPNSVSFCSAVVPFSSLFRTKLILFSVFAPVHAHRTTSPSVWKTSCRSNKSK